MIFQFQIGRDLWGIVTHNIRPCIHMIIEQANGVMTFESWQQHLIHINSLSVHFASIWANTLPPNVSWYVTWFVSWLGRNRWIENNPSNSSKFVNFVTDSTTFYTSRCGSRTDGPNADSSRRQKKATVNLQHQRRASHPRRHLSRRPAVTPNPPRYPALSQTAVWTRQRPSGARLL